MFYIGIEDLAANALIQVLQRGGERFLTYKEIESYGARVVLSLQKSGDRAVLILSRERTTAMLRDYGDFFEEGMRQGAKGISLKDGKSLDDLIEQFQGYLSLTVLEAFVKEKVA